MLPLDRLFPPLSSSRRRHHVTFFLLARAHFLPILHQSFTPVSPPMTLPHTHVHTHYPLFYKCTSSCLLVYTSKWNCSPAFPHTVEGKWRWWGGGVNSQETNMPPKTVWLTPIRSFEDSSRDSWTTPGKTCSLPPSRNSTQQAKRTVAMR